MAYSYCHGGDIETFVSEFGAQPIDLSANINPFGVPVPAWTAFSCVPCRKTGKSCNETGGLFVKNNRRTQWNKNAVSLPLRWQS